MLYHDRKSEAVPGCIAWLSEVWLFWAPEDDAALLTWVLFISEGPFAIAV